MMVTRSTGMCTETAAHIPNMREGGSSQEIDSKSSIRPVILFTPMLQNTCTFHKTVL